MILSRYPFPAGLIPPRSLYQQPTSKLLCNGLAIQMAYPGVPVYTPIGLCVLKSVEESLRKRFSNAGFDCVQLPHLVHSSEMKGGEKVGKQFAAKMMHLTGKMKEYHLLTTPEMLYVNMLRHREIAHTQLPLRNSYNSDFFRYIPNPKAILRGRQFRIFGAVSLEKDEIGIGEAIKLLLDLTIAELQERTLAWHLRSLSDKVGFEIFYPCDEGDYLLSCPNAFSVTEPREQVKALSLAIGYSYGRNLRLPIRYRTATNKNSRVNLASYGFCTNRLLFCVFNQARDAHGFNLPTAVRPFDVSIVPCTSSETPVAAAFTDALHRRGLRTVIDDRFKRTRIERASFADFIGIPVSIIVEKNGFKLRTRAGLQGAHCSKFEAAIHSAIMYAN